MKAFGNAIRLFLLKIPVSLLVFSYLLKPYFALLLALSGKNSEIKRAIQIYCSLYVGLPIENIENTEGVSYFRLIAFSYYRFISSNDNRAINDRPHIRIVTTRHNGFVKIIINSSDSHSFSTECCIRRYRDGCST
jgi:hypothetical protein